MKVAPLLLIAAAPLAAYAQQSMSPGQYEYTMKMEMPGMPFPMPPMTVKHCLTQADIDDGKQYQSQQQDSECQIKNLKQSAGKASFDLACEDGTNGHADFTFTGDGMSGKTVMTKDGTPMTMNMTAKRLGDCK